MLTCSWLIISVIFLMIRIPKLHQNATWLLIITCGGWFESMLGVLLILPYKYGIIRLSEDVFYGFESDKLLSLELSWKSAPLIVGSVLMWHYLGILNSGIILFVVERSIATVLLSDYEIKPRKHVFIILLITHQLSAIGLCIVCTFHMLPLNILLSFNVIGFVIGLPLIFFLRCYNKTARNKLRLAENITKHSLTAKFQTEENLRAMNIATTLATVAGIFDVFYIIIIILATQRVPGAEIFFQATEIVLFFNPIFTLPAMISSVPDWRAKFMEYLPISRLRIDPAHNPYAMRTVEEADVHFNQLHSLWV